MSAPDLEVLLQLLPEPTLLLRPDGALVYTNPALAHLRGGPVNAARLTDLICDPESKVRDLLSRWSRSAQPLPGALTLRAVGGQEIPCRCAGAALKQQPRLIFLRLVSRAAANTRFLGLSRRINELAQEVTARRRAEIELRRTQERLRLAQRAAKLGTWEWNIQTGQVVWSEEVESQHGFAPGSFGGTFQEWIATVHPDDCLPVQDAVRNAVENLGRYEIEYRTLRRDGSIYWTAARGQVFADTLGRPLRMAGVCMDISDQKRTQELLIQTEKLAAAGRLAATVAHEINNPLESVVNLLCLTQLDESLSPTARQYLTAADRELERVSLIARQTLGFYRGTTRREEVDLSELLDSIVAVYGRKLSDKSIVVEKRYRLHEQRVRRRSTPTAGEPGGQCCRCHA